MTTTPKTISEQSEISLQREMKRAINALTFIHANRSTLNSLDLHPNFYGGYCDFDNLDRPALLRVLKAFPGKWIKSNGYEARLNYTLDTPVCGLIVRVWGAEPPTCCVIEEKVEYIKIPEKIEKRVTRTIKCPEPQLQEVASEQL